MSFRKLFYSMGVFLCCSSMAYAGFAMEAPESSLETSEPVAHYSAATIENKDAAKIALVAAIAETDIILQENIPLSTADFERIHEISYTLEAAVDFLLEQKDSTLDQESLKSLDDAVQKLHYASEEYTETMVRVAFAEVQTVIASLAPLENR